MNYRTLTAKSDALRQTNAGKAAYAFALDVSDLISSAETNAHDTVPASDSDEWERVFMSTIEMQLCYCNDKKVAAWFRKQGVKW